MVWKDLRGNWAKPLRCPKNIPKDWFSDIPPYHRWNSDLQEMPFFMQIQSLLFLNFLSVNSLQVKPEIS